MRFRVYAAAAAMLAACLLPSYGQTATHQPAVKTHVASHKAKTPLPPTVQEQIQALRQQMEDRRLECRAYTRMEGEDAPEIRDWRWQA